MLEFFIRRPVFATVTSLMVVLIGVVAYSKLSVREYPNIEEPIISVRVDYPGASAEIMETQVIQVLEEEIAGIEGIETLTSSSEPEEGSININFGLDVDPDVAGLAPDRRRVDVQRLGQQLGGDGARSGARHRLRPDRFRGG